MLRNKFVVAFLKLLGGSACLGIGLKMLTVVDQPVVLPFLPNIFDWLSLIAIGVYLAVDGWRTGKVK